MTKEAKTTRNLKVIEQSGYRYQATPTVMLKGKWLSEFVFDIGTNVKVECEDGRLIITKEEARDCGDEGRVAEHGFQEAPQDQEAADGDVQKSSIRQTRVFLTEYGVIWWREFFLPLLMIGY